jgi:aspartyl-tRNA(Asn)/glutamyl-tRNA(Gln) amidotransferase subunit B
LLIPEEWINEIRSSLVELPDVKVAHYISEYELTHYEATVLTEERPVAKWFEAAVSAGGDPKSLSKWMINTLFGLMNEYKLSISNIAITPAELVELITLVNQAIINNNTAKDVLAEMFATGKSAGVIVREQGLAQITDEKSIDELVAQIIQDNPEQLAAYLAGKVQLKGWFVGQVMRASQGKANPALVNQLLSKHLATLDNQ